MNRPNVLTPSDPVALRSIRRTASPAERVRARVESRRRKGKGLVIAGWISALVGIVLYCVATFSAEAQAELAAVVLQGVVPGARAALVIIAGGTVLWIAGSVMHTGASLDAAELDARSQPHDETDGGR